MELYKLMDILSINNLNYENILINNFKIDSRKIQENDVFIVINTGYKYIFDAISNGAKVIVVPSLIDNKYLDNKDIIYLKVENTFEALKKIAVYLLNLNHPLTIAITGSNGKTTTKQLITSVLKTKYNVVSNIGNNNNLLGILVTLLDLKDQTEYLVLEIGMNHFGEISEISKIIKPDIGIITNIGSAHIGNLGSKKNILKAKLEIKDGNKDIFLLVNGEDKYLKKLKCHQVKKKEFNVPFDFMKMNFSIAYDLLKLFSFKDYEILKEFNKHKMYEHRMNIINTKEFTLIDDTYNASLESTIGGLSYINSFDNEKIIILGDILELGKYGRKVHKKINKYLKKVNNKEVLLLGNLTKYIKGKHFLNHDDLINYLNNISLNNKLIYLKGSHAMNINYIANELLNR